MRGDDGPDAGVVEPLVQLALMPQHDAPLRKARTEYLERPPVLRVHIEIGFTWNAGLVLLGGQDQEFTAIGVVVIVAAGFFSRALAQV